MSDPFWLTATQMARLEPYFPKPHGVPRVDDRHVLRNGMQWRDAPAVYGPHKSLYNRFIRWSRMGFLRISSMSYPGSYRRTKCRSTPPI